MGRITSSGSIVSISNEYVPPSDMEEVLTDTTIVHPTPQAQVDSQSYVANTVDIQNAVPDDSKIIQAMAEYVSGIPVTVTFYHVINNDTFGRSFSTDFDRELDPVHTSYLKILNFQMRLKDSMQFNYEQESTISQQTGEAVLYPYFCPNIGDVFLYTLPNNRVGLFKIIEAPIRLAIHDTTHHEIKFKLMEFMSKAMQDKLEASVSEIAHFNLKRYLADSGALLTSNETDILNKANSCYTVLVNAYGEEFYNRDVYNTFIEDVRLYDPYIIEFISRIVETNKLPGYPTQLMANPVNWKRSFWYKLLDPKMVPDNILIHKAARTLYKVNYRTARINALANRHYLELDPNSEFSYPPFKIPCEYTDKVISIPMQITLYLEQGKVRPSALMKLASDVLSMRRIARFYYIPIVLFLLKKLILALSSGKEDLILNDAIDSTCVQDCENCVYECDRNGDVVSCTLPEDAPPRYCAVIPACGGSTTDDDSTAHPPPWRTDGMDYSGGICNKVWRQAGYVNPAQPDSQVIRTDIFYTKEQIDGFIKTINHTIQRPDISTLPDETAIIDSKVDKVIGKELSDNNYTTEEKNKLAIAITSLPDASITVKGVIELATTEEVTAGEDSTKAVVPSTLKIELDKKADKTAGGTEVEYKVNGNLPDETGDFAVTAESIGAAVEDHLHDIADVEGLQAELDAKSDVGHTHELVSGVVIGESTLTGDVVLKPSENLLLSAAGNVVTVTPQPFTEDVAESVADANTSNSDPVQVFSGTQAEWDAFTRNPAVRYLVFIYE